MIKTAPASVKLHVKIHTLIFIIVYFINNCFVKTLWKRLRIERNLELQMRNEYIFYSETKKKKNISKFPVFQ